MSCDRCTFLSEIEQGKKAIISQLCCGHCDRLTAMGLGVGQEIAVIRVSHGKSPLMVRSGNSYMMLRPQDANKIQVDVVR